MLTGGDNVKGIIMEVHKNKAVVLTKEGSFLEIDKGDRALEIGQEITLDNNKRLNRQIIRRLVSAAAAFILLITTGYGVYGYYTPYGYVNVDINPSVEIAYNLYNRVIGLKGLNEDGNILISKMNDYKNKSIENVINKVIDKAVEEAYVKPEEENLILITITEKKDKIDDDKIYQSVDSHIKEKVKNTQVVIMEGDTKIYKKASEDKVSPGKLMLINKAIDLNKDIKYEEVANKSVKEIMKMIKEARKGNKEIEKEREKLEKKEEKEIKRMDKERIERKEKMRLDKDKLDIEIRKDKSEKEEKEDEEEKDKIEEEKEKKDIEKDKDEHNKVRAQEKLKERKEEKVKDLKSKEKDDEDKDIDDEAKDKNKDKDKDENKRKHDIKDKYKDKAKGKDK